MHRLNFKLDEFVRFSWATGRAQAKWGHVFNDLSNKFIEIERATVRLGMRRIALQHTADIITLTKNMMNDSLLAIPLTRTNTTDHYVSATKDFNPNLPFEYKVAIGRAKDIQLFITSYNLGIQGEIGDMLGYPTCCREFFDRYWVKEKWFDTTLPMVTHHGLNKETEKFYQLDPRNNILLRWLGLRPVSHLPCSFSCGPTQLVADIYGRAAQAIGMRKEWEQLLEILSWPVEWNSLHGIAQIITPVCKITTATDAISHKRTIQLVSDKYPEETGAGLVFPFIADCWTDNGFKSLGAMNAAHDRIIAALRPYQPKAIMDLGCGNMMLLDKLRKEFSARTWGVDYDADKKPDQVANIYDINFEGQPHYDVILVAAQRLEEDRDGWRRLEEKIIRKNVTDHLMVYDHATNDIYFKTYKETYEPNSDHPHSVGDSRT